MNTIKKWALVPLLVLSCLRYSNAQDVTGNLSDPYSWQGAGQIGVPITCMAPGQPGYCGPLPSVGGFSDPGGINFSYGYADLYQNINISNALPYSGTGLIVTGFNFGFTAKNGSGWDDGRTDVLGAYVNIYGPGGSLKENYNYNLNYAFNWTSFNYNETFASAYRTNQLSTARFGFVGQDNNYWAGFYGPEITNVSFSLKYAPDPCVTNPLSSPSCPGFSSALASRTTAPSTTEPTVTVTTNTTTSTAPTVISLVPVTGTSSTSSTASKSPMTTSRLESIARSVNEAVASTVQSTIQQSQDQARQIEQASQDTAAMSITTGAPRMGATDPVADNPAAGMTRPGDPAVAARGLSTPPQQEIPVESKPQPKNVQPPAELAGGISVAAFQAGADLTAYTNTVMRDAAFYPPRDIYRGQQTVDNARALRGLGSDRRHQEMVDGQWRR